MFLDKFYALQNGPPNAPQQILTSTTLRNCLVLLKDAVSSGAIANRPISDSDSTYGGHGPIDSKFAPISASAATKSEIWVAPIVMIGDAVGDLDANLREPESQPLFDWRQHSRQPEVVVGVTSIKSAAILTNNQVTSALVGMTNTATAHRRVQSTPGGTTSPFTGL